MYIIHRNPGLASYRVGDVNMGSEAYSITLHSYDQHMGEMTQVMRAPLDAFDLDREKLNVINWLISPEGSFPGASVVSDEDYAVVFSRMLLLTRVKELRDKAEASGAATPHGVFDSDPDSQRKVNGAVVMAMLDSENFSMEWRLKDNSIVTLDHDQMCQVGVAMGQHVAACQIRKNQLDAAIVAAETVADLEAIDIESGWPG